MKPVLRDRQARRRITPRHQRTLMLPSTEQMKPAVVLLSGGIDSTTTLAIAIAEGYEAYALSFEYGQRHQIETEAARRVADSLGAREYRVAKIDLRVFGGSALTGDVDVPKNRQE